MTTETILPDLIGTLAALPEHTQNTIQAYGDACYRTALQSPEVQAWKRDAERYRFIRQRSSPAEVHIHGVELGLATTWLDDAIDEEMEAWKI